MQIQNNSLTFLGVFLIGLGLNLTPCVYPMLSVTVSLFGKNRAENRLQAFVRALVYVLGMAVMYSGLGVLTAFTGGLFGSFLSNRFVLLIVATLFLLLALGMFGVYH